VRRLSSVLGTKVVGRDSASGIGKVHRVVIDPSSARVAAVQVGKGADDLVDWEHVVGLGDDAVVVEGESSRRAASGRFEERAVEGVLDLEGKRILSDRGHELGEVDDVEIDEQTGTVRALLAKGGRVVDGDRLLAIGSYAVVVSAADDDLSG
jgi:sporulation protein YlmC with PRC-barrel domain